MATINNISNDALQKVMMFLPSEDIRSFGPTSKRANCRLCKNDSFWKNYFDMYPEEIPRVFMKALKEDDKLYMQRASSHPKFLLPDEVLVMMDIIAEGPYNGKEHLITDVEKRVIELIIQHWEYVVETRDFDIDHIVLMLMTNGHIDAFMYLIEVFKKELHYYPWWSIKRAVQKVYESFDSPEDNEYDFVEYLRVDWMFGQVRGQMWEWEFRLRNSGNEV